MVGYEGLVVDREARRYVRPQMRPWTLSVTRAPGAIGVRRVIPAIAVNANITPSPLGRLPLVDGALQASDILS